jgi:hypothetical protein
MATPPVVGVGNPPSGPGVKGIGLQSNIGNADGVQGFGIGAGSGVAGFGDENGPPPGWPAPGAGVFGVGGAPSGVGVKGVGFGGPTIAWEVGGAMDATDAPGVLGQGGFVTDPADNISAGSNGVRGLGAGGAAGVAGFGDGGFPGVSINPQNGSGVGGVGGAPRGAGVEGHGFGAPRRIDPPADNAIGVFGQGGLAPSDGVVGLGSGNFSGVAGFGDGTLASASPNNGTGVFGLGGAPSGPGVRGIGHGGPNIQAPTNNAVGVLGRGGAGNSDGVVGFSSGTGAGVRGVASPDPSGVGHAGVFDGDVTVNGRFVVNGTKSAAIPFPDGSHRLLYALESPECWFEDFGMAKLTNGQAEVALDTGFAAVINGDVYHVFVSEYGDNNGLYVTDVTSSGFVVRAKASCLASSTFSYRIVAKRKGFFDGRFARATMASMSRLTAA